MPRVEQNIMIARSPEEVFGAVSDVMNSPSWITALVTIRDYEGSPSVGSTFTEIASFMGKTLETGKIVTVYDPPRCFAHRSTHGQVPQELTLMIDPVAGGSLLTLRFEAEPDGFFGSMPLSILVVAMEVLIRGNLAKLKGMLEKGEWPPVG